MSLVCTPTDILGYPPVQWSASDVTAQAKIDALKNAAPFGRGPNGEVITALQYSAAMHTQILAAEATDFRWPFWVGLGVATVGLGVLIAKKKR